MHFRGVLSDIPTTKNLKNYCRPNLIVYIYELYQNWYMFTKTKLTQL